MRNNAKFGRAAAGRKVLAFFLTVLFFIGLLAAIEYADSGNFLQDCWDMLKGDTEAIA